MNVANIATKEYRHAVAVVEHKIFLHLLNRAKYDVHIVREEISHMLRFVVQNSKIQILNTMV